MVRDRDTAAWTLGLLLATGSSLILVTLLFAGGADRTLLGVVAPAAAGYVAAGVLLARGPDLPEIAYGVAPLLATVVFALAAYYAGGSTAVAYTALLFGVAITVGLLFVSRVAIAHVALAMFAYVVVLRLRSPGSTSMVYVVTGLGTMAVAGSVTVLFQSRTTAAMRRLEATSQSDPLTGLANRRALDDRFRQALDRAIREGEPFAQILFDVDGLKRINEQLGHGAGDEAIVETAEALMSAARAMDTVARLDGDEFVVLLPAAGMEEAYQASERLRRSVETVFADWHMRVTVSGGVVSFPEHGRTMKELMNNADRSLYQAKRAGGNRSAMPERVRSSGPPGTLERRFGRSLDILLAIAEEVERRKGGRPETWRAGVIAHAAALRLGLPERQASEVRLATRLRDVGEIGVPMRIMSHAGPLQRGERRVVEKHPEIGARMVGRAAPPQMATWILSHHERPDGNGYPHRLFVDHVPLEARIVGAAGALAAMMANRNHRPPVPGPGALEELRRQAGQQFDPTVVSAIGGLTGADRGHASDQISRRQLFNPGDRTAL